MDQNGDDCKFGDGSFSAGLGGSSAKVLAYNAEIARETARLFHHENVMFSKSCSPPTADQLLLNAWNMISTREDDSFFDLKSDLPAGLIAVQTPYSFLHSENKQLSAQNERRSSRFFGEVAPLAQNINNLRMKFSLMLSKLKAERVGLDMDVETSRYFEIQNIAASGFLRPEVVEYRLYLAKYAFKYSMFSPRSEEWLLGLVTTAEGKEIRSLNCRLRLLQVDGLLTDVFRTRKETSLRAVLLRGKLKSLKAAYRLRNPSEFCANRNLWTSIWNDYLEFSESQRRARWEDICDDAENILSDLRCIDLLIDLPTGQQENIAKLNKLPETRTCPRIHRKYAQEVIMLASSFQHRSCDYLRNKIKIETRDANDRNRNHPGRLENAEDEIPTGSFGVRFDRFCTSLKKSFTSLFG